jgi:hypothetical protein
LDEGNEEAWIPPWIDIDGLDMTFSESESVFIVSPLITPSIPAYNSQKRLDRQQTGFPWLGGI